MNFDPVRTVKSVLEHYSSSGLDPEAHEVVSILPPGPGYLEGNAQHFEQATIYLLGHLLPDFNPLQLRFRIDGPTLRSTWELPKASQHAYHSLFEGISQDAAFGRFTEQTGTRLRCSIDPPALVLDFPVEHDTSLNPEASFDMDDLIRRYPSLDELAPLFEGYIHNARRHLDLLASAAAKLNWSEVHRHAHSLKGGAMNLAALPLAKLCQELESAAKTGTLDNVGEWLELAQRELQRLHEEFSARRGEFGG